jgi:hypothetical protein
MGGLSVFISSYQNQRKSKSKNRKISMHENNDQQGGRRVGCLLIKREREADRDFKSVRVTATVRSRGQKETGDSE